MGEAISDGILCLVEPVVECAFDDFEVLDGGLLQDPGFVLAIGGQGQFLYEVFNVGF
jgi:hypothetical protein